MAFAFQEIVLVGMLVLRLNGPSYLQMSVKQMRTQTGNDSTVHLIGFEVLETDKILVGSM